MGDKAASDAAESIEVEHNLKDSYCDKFRNELTSYYDKQLEKEISQLGSGMPDVVLGRVLGRYTAHLSRRINLLNAGLTGRDLSTFKALPQPAYEPALIRADSSLAPKIDAFFTSLQRQVNRRYSTPRSLVHGSVDPKRLAPAQQQRHGRLIRR